MCRIRFCKISFIDLSEVLGYDVVQLILFKNREMKKKKRN